MLKMLISNRFSCDLSDKEFAVDAGVTVQVGADNNNNNQISFGIRSHKAGDLGLSSADLGDDIGNAQTAITTLDAAIKEVNDARSNVGSLQNRLECTSSNLMNSIQNNSASRPPNNATGSSARTQTPTLGASGAASGIMSLLRPE